MSYVTFNIADSAVNANQTAMDTIAQNLANANTAGYVSETAEMSAVTGGDSAGVGDGVAVTSISQATDELLANSAQQAAGALSQATALQQALQQAQTAFPDPSSTGLSSDLSSFWQDWDSIASNPTSSAPRAAILDSAETLVSDFQQASQQLSTTTADTTSQLSNVVSSANTLLSQVATLNGQIVAGTAASSDTDSLVDQRNQLMTQLSQDIGAVGTANSDGSLQVRVGGVTLVQGNWSDTLSLTTGTSGDQIVASTSGATLSASSGTSAGLLAAVNQYLPSYQSQLNNAANALASTVNTQLEAGYTATGAAGVAMFTGSGAAGISVNSALTANPSLIAAASTSALPDATNDGSNAQALANLWDSTTGPDAAYDGLVQNVGDQVSSINEQVTAQTSLANTSQQNLQSIVGVNTNDQLTDLMTYQNSYQAAAKVITTVQSAIQSLLDAV